MIVCPVCCNTPSPLARDPAHLACSCGRLEYRPRSELWVFTVPGGGVIHPDGMEGFETLFADSGRGKSRFRRFPGVTSERDEVVRRAVDKARCRVVERVMKS